MIVKHYYIKLALLKLYNRVHESSNFYTASLLSCLYLRKQLIIELLLNFFMPIPGEEFTFDFKQLKRSVTYSLDDMIVSLMLIKIYHIFRLFGQYTTWTDPSCQHYW